MTALGTGSAFTLDNWHSNYLLEIGKYHLLIDCGSDIRHSLADVGLSYKDIDGAYISHNHDDHSNGLHWLGFSTYFDPTCDRPELFGSSSVLQSLWADVLCGGMGSIQGRVVGLSDYFDVTFVPDKNGKFSISSNGNYVSMQLVQTCHIVNGFYIVPSFGLMMDTLKQKVFFTTDTQFCPEQLVDFYTMADIIIQDCETLGTVENPIESHVHAHYARLQQLPENIKAKMWLTHYQDGAMLKYNPEDDGFLGFLQRGQVIEFLHPGSE